MSSNVTKRFVQYSIIGIGTFLLDLLLVRTFTGYGVAEYPAVVLSFLLAISVNFFISYRFVFKGTERSIKKGYLFFIIVALLGIVCIGPATIWLKNSYGLNLYIARSIVGGVVGCCNFLLNNFLNFKMGLR